jgi:hypothetical protein
MATAPRPVAGLAEIVAAQAAGGSARAAGEPAMERNR